MDGGDGGRDYAGNSENISRTFAPEPCGYVIEGAGLGARFCDAPAVKGSSYCVRHRALCAVLPGTKAAQAIAKGFSRTADRPAPPPPEAKEWPLAEAALETECSEVLCAIERERPEPADEGESL